MKTVTKKYLSVLIFLFGLSISAATFAQDTSHYDHALLAAQYENLAQEAQAKVTQQRNIIKNKPRTSFFGRNGSEIKKRVAFRIRKYERVALEHLAQADFHKQQLAKLQNNTELSAQPARFKEEL